MLHVNFSESTTHVLHGCWYRHDLMLSCLLSLIWAYQRTCAIEDNSSVDRLLVYKCVTWFMILHKRVDEASLEGVIVCKSNVDGLLYLVVFDVRVPLLDPWCCWIRLVYDKIFFQTFEIWFKKVAPESEGFEGLS